MKESCFYGGLAGLFAIQNGNSSYYSYDQEIGIVGNGYYDGGWKYKTTNRATRYIANIGTHTFEYAVSGTANAALTWLPALTIANNGAATFSAGVTFAGGVYNFIGANRFFAAASGSINYLYTGSTNLTILNQADTATLFTLANTGAATFNGDLTIQSGGGTKAYFVTNRFFGVNRNFQLAVDEYVEGAFTITPSTTEGGSTYTTPIFRLAATGAATFSSGIGIGGATATTGGIQFPTTEVNVNNANNLDDYEEGSFTPVLIGSSTAGTATYAAQNGRYVKIGRAVNFNLYCDWSAGTGTGNLYIGGLPYVADAAGIYPACAIGETSRITLAANGIMTARVQISDNRIFFAQYPSGGGNSSSVDYDGTGYVVLSGTYYV
jgi:hypothetical protein